jgi:hypothetical protein
VTWCRRANAQAAPMPEMPLPTTAILIDDSRRVVPR